jgi:hypothetical protein
VTEGAVLADGRLSVRLSVGSSRPEPFGSEAVVDDGPTRAEGSPGTRLAASFDRRAPRLLWPLTSHFSPSLVPCGLAKARRPFAVPAPVRGSAGGLRKVNWQDHSAKACQPLW